MLYNEDDEVFLDAENLAEGCFEQTFRTDVLKKLNLYLDIGDRFKEIYIKELEYVSFGGKNYNFHEPERSGEYHGPWANAAFAIFDIVNRQLEKADAKVRFYAVWSGNSLGGIFLSPEEVQGIRDEWMRMKADESLAYIPFPWPHLSTYEMPWWNRK